MPIAYTHDAYTTLHSHSVDITGHPTFLVRNATLAAHLALVVAAGGNGWALGRLVLLGLLLLGLPGRLLLQLRGPESARKERAHASVGRARVRWSGEGARREQPCGALRASST